MRSTGSRTSITPIVTKARSLRWAQRMGAGTGVGGRFSVVAHLALTKSDFQRQLSISHRWRCEQQGRGAGKHSGRTSDE
jgi:hypothetical protein